MSLSDEREIGTAPDGDKLAFYTEAKVKEFIEELKDKLFGTHQDQYVIGVGQSREIIDKLAGEKLI